VSPPRTDSRSDMNTNSLPLLQHALDSASAFTPERLMDAVRTKRGLALEAVPPLCVLDFDGDLSDRLAEQGISSPVASWACFHTSMRVMALDGLSCGIVPRTIGGPYAVLVAEQLCAAVAKLVVGITSAGRVSPTLPLPSIVVIDEAMRDEGTSLHYLAPSASVATPSPRLTDLLAQELTALRFSVSRGAVWTTNAPYRSSPSRELEKRRWGWSRSSATASISSAVSSTPAGMSFACTSLPRWPGPHRGISVHPRTAIPGVSSKERIWPDGSGVCTYLRCGHRAVVATLWLFQTWRFR